MILTRYYSFILSYILFKKIPYAKILHDMCEKIGIYLSIVHRHK